MKCLNEQGGIYLIDDKQTQRTRIVHPTSTTTENDDTVQSSVMTVVIVFVLGM